MNSKTLFTKTSSAIASVVLAIAGSLVAIQPANANAVTYTNTVPATFSLVNGVATYTPGTWTASNNTTPTLRMLWLYCDSEHNAAAGNNPSSPPSDCGPIAATDVSGTNNPPWITTNPLTIPATIFKWMSHGQSGIVTQSVTSSTKFITVYESIVNGNSWAMAPSIAIGPASQGSTAQVTREVTRIPDPPLQAPILNSLTPKLSSGFSSNGGRLVMKDIKPTDISSVTLNGKKVDVVPSKSGSALRIPAGSGAGDLTFRMADGSVFTVANAVKITPSAVDPKDVPLDSLPRFRGTSVNVPESIKTTLEKNKRIILESVSAKCVGFAARNTAASRAVALARATNVCGVITDINENIEPIVKVLVNPQVSRKTAVRYLTW
jgi:hypothetical protein